MANKRYKYVFAKAYIVKIKPQANSYSNLYVKPIFTSARKKLKCLATSYCSAASYYVASSIDDDRNQVSLLAKLKLSPKLWQNLDAKGDSLFLVLCSSRRWNTPMMAPNWSHAGAFPLHI